jgi:glycosyltransferase involved in cell wall biosynthesis
VQEGVEEILSHKALSVLIPTYNRPDALLKCLAHLESQTFKEFDVVIVDDGSTDATAQQVKSYMTNSSLAVRYIYQNNGGPAKARNFGISIIDTPVCLMIGDDIFASPNFIEVHAKFHETNPSLNAAGLGLTKWHTSAQTITPFMQWLGESPVQFAYKELLGGCPPSWEHFYTSNLSVKTELLRKLPFSEKFPYAAMEDSELGYRIQNRFGLALAFIPDALAEHLHPTTFRQACERMIRVGYSLHLFHELWPEQRHTPGQFKRFVKSIFIDSPVLLRLLSGVAGVWAKISCPNPLMLWALACYREIGYQSSRSASGRLERSR